MKMTCYCWQSRKWTEVGNFHWNHNFIYTIFNHYLKHFWSEEFDETIITAGGIKSMCDTQVPLIVWNIFMYKQTEFYSSDNGDYITEMYTGKKQKLYNIFT